MNRVFINVTGSGARQTRADPPGGTTATRRSYLFAAAAATAATAATAIRDGGGERFSCAYSPGADPRRALYLYDSRV